MLHKQSEELWKEKIVKEKNWEKVLENIGKNIRKKIWKSLQINSAPFFACKSDNKGTELIRRRNNKKSSIKNFDKNIRRI